MKRSIVAAIGLSLFLMAGNAHAVLFQFYTTSPLAASNHDCPDAEVPGLPACPANDIDSRADGNGDGILSFTDNGISVMAQETTNNGSHLYADYNPTEGGLGALLDNTAEDPDTNPDNLINGQSLLFTFDQQVFLNFVVHFDENHMLAFDGNPDYLLIVDGNEAGAIMVTIAGDGMQNFGGLPGTTFEFRSLGEGMGGEGFYVSAFDVGAIPEPGTAMLLGLGFIGLGAARRRAA